jgi:hypothetical protein
VSTYSNLDYHALADDEEVVASFLADIGTAGKSWPAQDTPAFQNLLWHIATGSTAHSGVTTRFFSRVLRGSMEALDIVKPESTDHTADQRFRELRQETVRVGLVEFRDLSYQVRAGMITARRKKR